LNRLLIIAHLLPGLMLVSAPGAAQSRTLDVGGARINYVVTGAGPAVVLIHGWALSLRETRWCSMVEASPTTFPYRHRPSPGSPWPSRSRGSMAWTPCST
jgi:pimeloyl-ACP methyl ester carboxylesterase